MTQKFPPVIRIEPASSCNLRCQHCPTGLGASPKGILSLELFDKILNELRENIEDISTVVLYHGGEPLLNSNLVFFITQLKGIGIRKIKIVTNGKLLTDQKCLELVLSGLDEIEISLDGISPSDSEAIRSRSHSSFTIAAIKTLQSQKNANCSNLKITISSTQFIDDFPKEDRNSKVPPIPEWLKEFMENEIEIKTNWAIQWPGGFPKDSKIVFEESNAPKPTKCSLLEETMTIRSNGDVVVCCYDLTSLSVIGNVFETSISEVLNSKKLREIKTNFQNQIYSSPCNSCAVVTGKRFLGKNLLISQS
jgi:radical SAM protein with 4Fe4S-binding SPASM domain